MAEFEKIIYQGLYDNAILFLKDGIEKLISCNGIEDNNVTHNLLTLACASFQISIELAMKSLIVEKVGIRKILNTKQQNLTDEEIKDLLGQNSLKTLDFEAQKNFIKAENLIQDLIKGHFKKIDEFQLYRNRIVHFFYRFSDERLLELNNDIVYYLIHIIFRILLKNSYYDIRPSEFIQFHLKGDLYKKLLNYSPYITAMEKMATENSLKVFRCIVCNNKTYSQENEYCYCCNFQGIDYTPINCDYCGEKRSFIYDNLNIELNNNEMRGLCLNCGNDGIVFQCPICSNSYILETSLSTICTNERCLFE